MKGNIVKLLRKEKGLTQEELARKLGISKSTIGMIESEQREGSREVVNKMSDFFNVSLDFLDGRTTERNIDDQSKSRLIDDFLNTLIEEGIITDSNNIDNDTAEMILNAVKAQVALKLKKHKKDDK